MHSSSGVHDLVGDKYGLVERLAAMHHAVAHSVDLLHGADDAVVLVHQSVQHSLNGLGMGGHGHVNGVQHLLALYLGLVGELAVNADALAQALGQQHAGLGVQQLILQRGTARVDNQNIHRWNLLLLLRKPCQLSIIKIQCKYDVCIYANSLISL